jgi:hypothetical protein
MGIAWFRRTSSLLLQLLQFDFGVCGRFVNLLLRILLLGCASNHHLGSLLLGVEHFPLVADNALFLHLYGTLIERPGDGVFIGIGRQYSIFNRVVCIFASLPRASNRLGQTAWAYFERHLCTHIPPVNISCCELLAGNLTTESTADLRAQRSRSALECAHGALYPFQ